MLYRHSSPPICKQPECGRSFEYNCLIISHWHFFNHSPLLIIGQTVDAVEPMSLKTDTVRILKECSTFLFPDTTMPMSPPSPSVKRIGDLLITMAMGVPPERKHSRNIKQPHMPTSQYEMQHEGISAMTRGVVRHDILHLPLALHGAQQRLEESQARGVLDVVLRTVAACQRG